MMPMFVSDMDYMFNMEMNFHKDPKVNFFANFAMQFFSFINVIIFFQINLMVLFAFTINVFYELKLISVVCQKVGSSYDEDAKPEKNSNQNLAVLEKQSKETNRLVVGTNKIRKTVKKIPQIIEVQAYFEQPKINIDEGLVTVNTINTKALLETILNYHTNVIS